MIRAAAGLLLAAALAGPAVAQDQPTGPTTDRGTARAKGALLRGLDKITGATSDLPVAVGDAVAFGRLEVRLGECRYPVDDPGSDAFAQMTVTDTTRHHTVFTGWMIASSPALSALDDARYDIWVVSCDMNAGKALGPADKGDAAPISPAEAGGEAAPAR